MQTYYCNAIFYFYLYYHTALIHLQSHNREAGFLPNIIPNTDIFLADEGLNSQVHSYFKATYCSSNSSLSNLYEKRTKPQW